jgi:large subunit ribosomal protein L17
MQHNRFGRKLGRTTSHRLAMFRNQLASLVSSERIVTTLAKAKELRPIAERVVTQGKRGTVHARRLVGRWIQSRDVIKKLFDEVAPRFATRPGGYLRIVKLGPRQGDGAEMAVLEFVDFEPKKKAAPPPAAEGKGRGKGKAAAPELEPEEGEAAEKPAKAPKKQAAPRPDKKSQPKAKPGKGPAGAKKTSAPKKIGSS